MRKSGVRSPDGAAGRRRAVGRREVGLHEPLHEAHHRAGRARRGRLSGPSRKTRSPPRPAPARGGPRFPAWLAAARPGGHSASCRPPPGAGTAGARPRGTATSSAGSRSPPPTTRTRSTASSTPRGRPPVEARRADSERAEQAEERGRVGLHGADARRAGRRRRRTRVGAAAGGGRTAFQTEALDRGVDRPRRRLGLADLNGRVVLRCERVEPQGVGCGGHDRGECSLAGDPIRSARSSASP